MQLPTDEIEVVIGDAPEHIDEVLSVVHDGFVEAGYMEPQATGRRMHVSYLNPGTCFALARVDGEAIGAAVLVIDGPFGVPSDRSFAEENDRLRATHTAPLMECGSLVVRPQWRRHTRRVFMRLISALTRISLVEWPESPVVITVSPQSERFYAGILGMRRVAEERPLFGPPALALHPGTILDMVAHTALRESPGQRAMNRLIVETDPSWLHDLRTGRGIDDALLRDLVTGQGLGDRLQDQIRFLAARHPAALRAMMSEAGAPLHA
ncbi:MAG: hypothetical protein AB7V42_14530 [Thermoleophilia bacterium]